MSDGIYDIVCKQGETFSRLLTVTDSAGGATNLTGYSARMQVRATHASSAVLLELSTTNSRISINAALGKLALEVTDEVTSTLSPVKAVYDLVITDATGKATRLLEGKFVITAGVTRVA